MRRPFSVTSCLVGSLLLFPLQQCTTPNPSASDADVLGDAVLSEASTDAPSGPVVREAQSCDTCVFDEECGPGGFCAELNRMTAPSFRTCLVACSEVGAPCSARGIAGRCNTELTGVAVCEPSMPCQQSVRGAACPANGCVGRYSTCAQLPTSAAAVCLANCTRDADCENAFARCREVRSNSGATTMACIPDEVVDPAACGQRAVNSLGVGAPCPNCAMGLGCVNNLPMGAPAMCSLNCTTDSECGANAYCASVGGMQRCLPDDCDFRIERTPSTLLDQALTASMLTRRDLYFGPSVLDAFGPSVTRDRFRLPIFSRIHRDFAAGARFARRTGPSLDARAEALSSMIAAAAGLRLNGDAASIAVGFPTTLLMNDAPLALAVAELDRAAGGTPDEAALRASASSIAMDVQLAVATVLRSMAETYIARNRGVRSEWSLEEKERLWSIAAHQILAGPDILNPLDGRDLAAILGDVELPVTQTVTLAKTIETTGWAALMGRMGVSFTATTAAGVVAIRGGGADMYSDAEFAASALIVDLGGDDVYRAPVAANQSFANGVSVLIDLGGADDYGYTEVANAIDMRGFLPSDRAGRDPRGAYSRSEVYRQGAGRMGVALLYDLGEQNDRYRSLRGSQGFGALGIGALFDAGGNDEYAAEAGAQGSAVLGIGVLLDRAGTDRYTAWNNAQGFGYVRGVGLLYDNDGSDEYVGKSSPVAYPSPQNPMVNSSFVQGAGFGRRADGIDNVNMSGGMGILRDHLGNDRYSAAIFAQATGYWGGMGLLLDGAGDDQYNARWYVQAGAAHFAYSALVDGGGTDVHNMDVERQNMTAGAGHDFSASYFFADGMEGDTYNVPNLALGAGNANGVGFFGESGGNDTYNAASALTLGNAALETLMDPGRLERKTWGVFLDSGGMDTYTRMNVGPVNNNAVWSQRIHPEAPSETGLGADGTAPLGI